MSDEITSGAPAPTKPARRPARKNVAKELHLLPAPRKNAVKKPSASPVAPVATNLPQPPTRALPRPAGKRNVKIAPPAPAVMPATPPRITASSSPPTPPTQTIAPANAPAQNAPRKNNSRRRGRRPQAAKIAPPPTSPVISATTISPNASSITAPVAAPVKIATAENPSSANNPTKPPSITSTPTALPPVNNAASPSRRWLWKGRKNTGDDEARRASGNWRAAYPASTGVPENPVGAETAVGEPPFAAPEKTVVPALTTAQSTAEIAPVALTAPAANNEKLPAVPAPNATAPANRESLDIAAADAITETPPPPKDREKKSEPKKPRQPTGRKMLLNVIDAEQARVAIIGNNGLEELYIERAGGQFVHGNIFKGRVVNIQPNLQAAFIDIGSEKHAFLHVDDVIPPFGGYEDILTRRRKKAPTNPQFMKINDMLADGQELLVQITREALPTKGPSVTTYISLPGRYLVLMPASHTRGVSKKITNENQRRELRRELAKLSPPKDMGFIIRTAGLGHGAEELQLDLNALTELWQEICERTRKAKSPELLYHENELTIRAIRDYCNDSLDELFIDRREEYAKAVAFIKRMMPDFYQRTRLYDKREPLLAAYKVEDDIEKLFDEAVKLPSGGEILIQQTEALVAIDVNTGKMLKAESSREMIKKTNLEAAAAIARQLRLRDMGGLVMIDFIDMEHAADQREVEDAMRAATKSDRARITILPISRLGIMEMTRQRLRQSLHLAHYQSCPYCGGSGKCRKPESLGAEFVRKLRAELGKGADVRVTFHPRAALTIANELRQKLLELETEFQRKIVVAADEKLRLDQYVFTPLDKA